MIVLMGIIFILMCFGIFVGTYDLEQEKGYSAPVLLLLIVMPFISWLGNNKDI